LVLGGLAVRLELTFEHLEDLQVALGALLECCDEDDDVTVQIALEDATLRLSVGPFERDSLAGALDRVPVGGPNLQRVLETVADSVERVERNDGAWVELTKQLERADG
jgi:hypothetical protein